MGRYALIKNFYGVSLVILFFLPSLLFAEEKIKLTKTEKVKKKSTTEMPMPVSVEAPAANNTINSERRHTLYLMPSFFLTQGKMADMLPTGFGQYLQYSWDLEKIDSSMQSFWRMLVHSLTAETGYFSFSKAGAAISLIPLSAGPEWVFKPFTAKTHALFIRPSGGIAYILTSTKTYSASGIVGAAHIATGYRYLWPQVSLALTLRYSYFFDGDVLYSLQGVGISIVTGYNF